MKTMREILLDLYTMASVYHKRETTGIGPSYVEYRGQMEATLKEAFEILEATRPFRPDELPPS